MKCRDTELFGDWENERLDDDLFSIADLAQLLLLGLRRSGARCGEPDNQGNMFVSDTRFEAGVAFEQRAAKFHESLFGALLGAAIDESRRHRDSHGLDWPWRVAADGEAGGQHFDGFGVMHDADQYLAFHEGGYRIHSDVTESTRWLVDSQRLHLAIIGQDHDEVLAVVPAHCHHATRRLAQDTRHLRKQHLPRKYRNQCLKQQIEPNRMTREVRFNRARRVVWQLRPWGAHSQTARILKKV